MDTHDVNITTDLLTSEKPQFKHLHASPTDADERHTHGHTQIYTHTHVPGFRLKCWGVSLSGLTAAGLHGETEEPERPGADYGDMRWIGEYE